MLTVNQCLEFALCDRGMQQSSDVADDGTSLSVAIKTVILNFKIKVLLIVVPYKLTLSSNKTKCEDALNI